MRVRGNGFTLVELIVTISIVAIISAMAVPSFIQTIRKMQINDSAKGLANDIVEIRSLAIMSKKDQIINFDSSQAGAWKANNDVSLTSISDSSKELKYSIYGLLKATNNVCFLLQHDKDSNFKAVIIARKNGLVIYDKSLKACPSDLSDG